jgi:hypothetical protein
MSIDLTKILEFFSTSLCLVWTNIKIWKHFKTYHFEIMEGLLKSWLILHAIWALGLFSSNKGKHFLIITGGGTVRGRGRREL